MLSDHIYEANLPQSQYNKEEDYKLTHPIMPPMIPLVDLCTHFRDLPSFVHHPDFDHFAYCWMEFQYQIAMSQHPHCRPGVQSWLVTMSAQLLDWIAKYPSPPPPPPPPHPYHVPVVVIQEDHEASTYHMKSAYQRLVHRFGVLYKLLSMIDHGSIVANQSPQEVVLPIYNTLLKHKLTQPCYSPSSLYDYFSLTSSPSPTSSSGMSTPSMPLSLLSLSSPEPAATTTTSSFRSPSCMQAILYLNDSNGAPSPHIHPMSLVLPPPPPPPSPSHIIQTLPEAPQHHHPLSWSTPATPSPVDHPPATQFWSSCPVSPSYPRRRCTSLPDPLPLSTHQLYREEQVDEPITPSPSACRPPPPTLGEEEDELSSEYRPDNDEEEDEEEDADVADHNDDDDDDDDDDYNPSVTTTPKTNKYDSIPSSPPVITDMAATSSQRAKHRRRALSFKSRSTMSLVTLTPNSPTNTNAAAAAKIRRRGRTATSYDQDTTHFLKSMFFNIYSQRDKLTKEQRRQVVERTGLKPRNVTYWFSNHKRRFQSDLDVFRKLIAESNGRIQTYDDYVAWRREQGLPEMVGDNDM